MLLKGLFLHRVLGRMSLCAAFLKRYSLVGQNPVGLVDVGPIGLQNQMF